RPQVMPDIGVRQRGCPPCRGSTKGRGRPALTRWQAQYQPAAHRNAEDTTHPLLRNSSPPVRPDYVAPVIDPSARMPLYRQMADDLHQRITAGEYPPG